MFERNKKILEMYVRDQLNQREIAVELGISQALVSLVLIEAGVKCKDSRHLDWDVDQLRQWYEIDRMTVQQIADKLGRHRVAVNKALRRLGIRMRRRGPKNGPDHPGWKGERKIDKDGYVLFWCPGHPRAREKGYVLEHRLVAEVLLGRLLSAKEVVHHVNGIVSDNRPENLQVFDSNSDHLKFELTGKIPNWTPDGLRKIAEGVRKSRHRRRKPNRKKSKRDGTK